MVFHEFLLTQSASRTVPARLGRRLGILAWTVSACMLLASCRNEPSADPPNPEEQLVSEEARVLAPARPRFSFHEFRPWGKDLRYHNGEDSNYFAILEALGGGVGVLDYDRDGLWDAFFPGGGDLLPGNRMSSRPSSLWRNTGDNRDWQEVPGLPAAIHFSHGAAARDFDNDGFADVLVTGYGGVQLLKNQGDGTFEDITANSGLETATQWSTTAGWGDLNGDGNLDLYVANYVNWSFENNPRCETRPERQRDTCPPRTFESLTDDVFLSDGSGGFAPSREELGFSEGGNGLGVLIADLDDDNDLDVYVANDGTPNALYKNEDGVFTDVSVISGADRNDRGLSDGSMGIEAGDFNGDGLPDLWVSNYEQESMGLYRAQPNLFYQHVSQPMGVAAMGPTYVGWGMHLDDFDADGDEDLFIATGHAVRHSKSAPRLQRPIMLENDQNKRFRNVGSQLDGYFQEGHLGRGVAGLDADNDGRCDMIVTDLHAPPVLLQNTAPTTGAWVGFHLVGTVSPRQPVGAKVRRADKDGSTWKFLKGGSSYLSTPDPRLLFQLTDRAETAEFEIIWPSGNRQSIVVKAGQYHTIIER